MNDTDLTKATAEFMGAFELVFHHDWEYSTIMMGDQEDGCTFLKPGLADEIEDWGARGLLLEKYRELARLMRAKGIEPTLPSNWDDFPRIEGLP